jgi:hypothetical protein
MKCECAFCSSKPPRPHPDDRHPRFERISDHLLVAESLDPNDSIPMEACWTCGHKRPMKKGN